MAKQAGFLRWLLLFAALLLIAALAAPFLVPLSGFIPQLQELASKAIGQPVAIADLRLHLLPTPRAVASGLRVGKKDDVKVGELEIVPDLAALAAGRKSLALVRAENVELKESALSIPGRMPKSDAEPVAVKRIEARQVRLHHSKVRLPEFDLDAGLAEGNMIESLRFETRDGAMRLRAQGTTKDKQLDMPKIEGDLYGGRLSGTLKADWARLWKLGGTLKLAGVDIARVQQALGRPPRLTGRLDAGATYSAAAKSPDLLANALAVDGPFTVAGGAYQGVDLSKVGDLTGSKGAGGVTRFDELRGKLRLRGKTVRIHELCAKSSTLVAGGFVAVAPDQKLSGRLDVSIAKTGGFVGVPVALSGTTSDPAFRPTRGYTAGAILGTVLLPGVGTALGGSAGAAVEGKAAECK